MIRSGPFPPVCSRACATPLSAAATTHRTNAPTAPSAMSRRWRVHVCQGRPFPPRSREPSPPASSDGPEPMITTVSRCGCEHLDAVQAHANGSATVARSDGRSAGSGDQVLHGDRRHRRRTRACAWEQVSRTGDVRRIGSGIRPCTSGSDRT
jgi:hypothetical protein